MTRDAFYKAEKLDKELRAITKMKNIISNSTLSGDEYYAAHDALFIKELKPGLKEEYMKKIGREE